MNKIKMGKTKSLKKIKLEDLKKGARRTTEIQTIIRKEIALHLFHDNPNVLAFHALQFFNLKKDSYNIRDVKSIEKACLEILQAMDIYKDGEIDIDLKRKNEALSYNPVGHFITYIIGFYQLPYKVQQELEGKVRKDLLKINKLKQEYETDAVIVDFLENGNIRNEHESKIRLDFYKRCVKEYDTIVKYLTEGIEARALYKASINNEINFFGTQFHEAHYDRPYRWWALHTMEYFDYRKINLCKHRLQSVENYKELQTLYLKGDKLKFYRRVKRSKPPAQVFQEILNFYIGMIPSIEQRKDIFKELESLFRSRKWYGFTALALTQVEGLFSDMVALVKPPKKVSSLPTKVNALRLLFEYEKQSFDYFEYHLPRLRNRFLHTGKMQNEDFRILALDLLYDLSYLMKSFHELNDPHIELHKLFRRNNLDTINTVGDFNHIFRLVKSIRDRLKKNAGDDSLKTILKEWDHFEKEVIAPSRFAEFFLGTANQNIDKQMQDFFDLIKSGTAYNGSAIELDKISQKELHTKKDEIIKSIEDVWIKDYDSYNVLLDYSLFISDYHFYLKHDIDALKYIANQIKERHQDNFKKLMFINPAFYPPVNK